MEIAIFRDIYDFVVFWCCFDDLVLAWLHDAAVARTEVVAEVAASEERAAAVGVPVQLI